MNEVFRVDTLVSPSGGLRDPWEISYGPDDSLWITEVSSSNATPGYKVDKVHPVDGGMRTVLNLLTFTDGASSPVTKWQKQPFNGFTPNPKLPQGGLMGLAIHPEFKTNPAKRWVYLAYIHNYVPDSMEASGVKAKGYLYRTWVVRFTYNTTTWQLESPVAIADTINGGSDHNSGRMIIAPVNGVNYLFYAVGDLGAGQFEEVQRSNNAQNKRAYEGKILRFNLEPDADAGTYDRWIPSTVADPNPFTATVGYQSAVYTYGMRNNQGFAYDTANDILYGSSHGPFTDDEVNIIEKGMNYGHPYVEGYGGDDNYNGSRAATATFTFNSTTYNTSVPLISDESHNRDSLVALGNYRDPIFAGYNAPQSTVNFWYNDGTTNGSWPSEGWSGLGFYDNPIIPGWKGSLLAGSLKWGRLVRLKLNAAGTAVVATAGADSVANFQSKNKFRDMAIDSAGSIYTVFDRSATSSGPSAGVGGTSITPDCAGCVQKYTFLGYKRIFANNKSTLPTSIPVSPGTNNACISGTPVTVNSDNDTLWIPITGPDGNVVAEIKPNGRPMGKITSSFYTQAGVRTKPNGVKFLSRNITITPQTQPGGNVDIRLYMTGAEFNALNTASTSINSITQVQLVKNGDPCLNSNAQATSAVTVTYAEAFGGNYVIQATVNSFSTFWFSEGNLTLPVELVRFEGELKSNGTNLSWETATELNTSRYVIERSLDGSNFQSIGTVKATGNSSSTLDYSYIDEEAGSLPAIMIYYRLKIIDIDESTKYSNIISVSLADIAGKLVVTPNPTTGISKVNMTSKGEALAKWKLTDNTGRVLLSNNVQLKKGNNNMTIDLTKLAAGIYYLNVSGGGIDKKVKVQKL
jgi:glucose/arabinose dehydrogenase